VTVVDAPLMGAEQPSLRQRGDAPSSSAPASSPRARGSLAACLAVVAERVGPGATLPAVGDDCRPWLDVSR